MSSLGGGGDVCFFCGKKVFMTEKKTQGDKVFHGPCFKCHDCKRAVPLEISSNFLDGKLYCRFHLLKAQEAAAKASPAAASSAVTAAKPSASSPITPEAPSSSAPEPEPVSDPATAPMGDQPTPQEDEN